MINAATRAGLTLVKDCVDIDVIRNLQPGIVNLVTDELLMWGVDYHSQNAKGIELLITSMLSNERALQQSYKRVGRD